MTEIPSPIDVLVSTLLWLGFPALVLFPFVVALSIAEWVRLGAHTAEFAQKVSVRLNSRWGGLGGQTKGRIVLLVTAQSILVAAVYALFRLIYAMGVADSSDSSIADGRFFLWSELWANIVTYNDDSELAKNAALLTLGWVVGLDIAAIFGLQIVLRVLALVEWPVGIMSVIGAILTGIVGLMVLSSATWLNDPHYDIEMVSLYVCWVVLLVLVAITVSGSVRHARGIFAHNLERRK